MAILSQAQDGHVITYTRQPSVVQYRVKGAVLSSYSGGIDAPGMRQCEISGTYTLRTEARGEKWVVVSEPGKLIAAKEKSKPLSAADAKLALRGSWVSALGAEDAFLVNTSLATPSQMSAPLWPIVWRPIEPKDPLKVGDEFIHMFRFPLQAFLEDDPIGFTVVPIRFVFNGAEYPASSGLWGFSIKTDHDLDVKVKHPEEPNLQLKGKILIDGRLKVRRSDGRLESASVIMSVDIGLFGAKYPFGFSKAKASVSANYERVN